MITPTRVVAYACAQLNISIPTEYWLAAVLARRRGTATKAWAVWVWVIILIAHAILAYNSGTVLARVKKMDFRGAVVPFTLLIYAFGK